MGLANSHFIKQRLRKQPETMKNLRYEVCESFQHNLAPVFGQGFHNRSAESRRISASRIGFETADTRPSECFVRALCTAAKFSMTTQGQ